MLFICPGLGNLTFLASISALSWQTGWPGAGLCRKVASGLLELSAWSGRKESDSLQLSLFLNSEKLTGSPGTRVTLLGSMSCTRLPGKLSRWLSAKVIY